MVESSAARIAHLTSRLAVLLGAGIPAASAWGYLLDLDDEVAAGSHTSRIAAAHAAAAAGLDVASALGGPTRGVSASARTEHADEPAWNALAAAWSVASQVGAPIAATLEELADCLRDVAEAEREAAVALAGPAATSRLVMVLPVLGVLGGGILGFDTAHVLFATTPGLVCLAAGGGLMLAAWRWNRALVRRATPPVVIPALHFDLLAIAMSGGGALQDARATVDAALSEFEIPNDARVEPVIELAARAGVPAARLLRAEAREVRRDARASAQRAVAVLGVRLMIPLGVCVLPAFMLLGVAPLVLAVISSTVTKF